MKYNKTQQEIIDRYMEATKDSPDSRISIATLLGLKAHMPRARPDKYILQSCEQAYLEETPVNAGRQKRQIDNRLVSQVFGEYDSYNEAKKRFYWLDDILTGVSFLDMGGNTRPLGLGMMFNFVSTSTVINTDIIQDFCSVQPRQAQKIMLALVIAHRMIEKELHRMGFVLELSSENEPLTESLI